MQATARVADGRPGFGMLIDGTYGREALFRAADHPFWIGRPVELPGSRPLDFENGGSLGAQLVEWPVGHTIKCLCFYHPDDPPDLKARQDRELLRLHEAARALGRELLVEVICVTPAIWPKRRSSGAASRRSRCRRWPSPSPCTPSCSP